MRNFSRAAVKNPLDKGTVVYQAGVAFRHL
jgi:hypothetical protein